MPKIWIVCAVMAVALTGGLALLPVTAEELNVTGTWTGTQGHSALPFRADATMVLSQDGQNVTGAFSRKVTQGGADKGAIIDLPMKGTLTGDKLVLMIGQHWRFDLTVNGSEMRGYSTFANNPALTMTMTRAK